MIYNKLMKKWINILFKNKENVIVVLVLLVSAYFVRFWQTPWWINLSMILLWLGMVKIKPKYSWIFLIVLVIINLNLNRLLYFKINPLSISFDVEQSFWNYPGIRSSILRYKQEGLWLPFRLRGCFYSLYLVFFSYLSGVAKLISPLFWVRIIGFSGFTLFLLGIISYFKNGFKKNYVGFWFLLIILSSACRVLGDTVTAVYLTVPVITVLLVKGIRSDFFKKYQFYWYLIFLLDILLR